MAALILPRRFYSQPQGAVELGDAYNPGDIAFIGGRSMLLLGPYTTGGTLPTVGVCDGGTTTSGDGTSYINLGNLPHAQPGRFSWVFQIVPRSTAAQWLTGTVSTGAGYLEQIGLNYNEGEVATAGSLYLQIRSASPNNILRAAIPSVLTVGKLVTIAINFSSDTTFECYIDGKLATFTYGSQQTVAGLSGNVEFAIDLLNRNVRGVHSGGATAFVVMFARLQRQIDAQALSQNPWQLFRPLVRRLYFDLGAGGGFTDSALSAVGAAAVALASQAIAKAALSSAGAATASAVGQALAQASLSAQGSATVAATGQALYSATVTPAGVAAASFAGKSISVSALASSGIATNSWTAKALASSTVAAAGIAAATFVPLGGGVVSAAMSSAGVGAFSVVAQSITQAAMGAVGAGSASWVSLVTGYADASFVMAGAAAISLAAQAIAQTAASSAATSAAAFGAQTLRQGAFSAAGSATSAWSGKSIAGVALSAVGAGVAAFVGKAIVQASAFAAGAGSVNWVHGNGPVVPALLRITAIRLMTAVSARSEITPHVSARHRLN